MNTKFFHKILLAVFAMLFAITAKATDRPNTLNIMVDDVVIYDILLADFDSITLNSGAIPNTLHIMAENVAIHSIPVADFDSITLSFVDTPPVTGGVVINGVTWATRNVDAPGTFVANPQDFGMFYQWNRILGWSSTNPRIDSNGEESVWNRDDPTGTYWSSANDPCPPGWRVPNSQELQSLNNAGSTWTTNWNGIGVSGRVFGTAPNQIFLPAAGRRSTMGSLGAAGYGYYWSSTHFGPGRWAIEFSSSAQNDIGGGFSGASAYSIRCVVAE